MRACLVIVLGNQPALDLGRHGGIFVEFHPEFGAALREGAQ